MSETSLPKIADCLYAAPLGEFTASRDAEARAIIRESGDRELAASVRALKKPSLAAWVVNLLVRNEGDQISEILMVAEGLRAAQTAMDGAQLRALTRQRRQLTAAVTTRARALAAEHGVRVTSTVAEQIEATLTAALLNADAAAALRTGLLVEPLTPTGVTERSPLLALAIPEALGYVPTQAPPAKLRVVPDPDAGAKTEAALRATQRAALEAALASAQEQVRSARADYRSAQEAVSALQARTLQGQAEMDELNRRLTSIESELERLDDELADAERNAADAESMVVAAEETRDRAARAMDRSS